MFLYGINESICSGRHSEIAILNLAVVTVVVSRMRLDEGKKGPLGKIFSVALSVFNPKEVWWFYLLCR